MANREPNIAMYPKMGLRLLTERISETIPMAGNKIIYTSGWPRNQNKCWYKISTHEDITHIHTTYFDNYGNLSYDYILKINAIKEQSPEAYAHRFLGKWLDKKQGVIFPNWVEGEFDKSLPFAYGLDFGFYPDPLALVKVAVDKGAKKIYVQEVIYKQSLSYEAVIEQINASWIFFPSSSKKCLQYPAPSLSSSL